jgi:hypothetical protein
LNEKRTASAREAARSVENEPLAIALDDHLAIMVDVTVAIMTSPDHDGVVAIPGVAVTNDLPVAITVAGNMTGPTVTPAGPTPMPTSSAPAGIANEIPATATAATKRRLIIACSFE